MIPSSVILMKISWQVTLLHLHFVDGTTITTKYFNATNAHNYVLFKQNLWDKVCSKRNLWSCHHWEKMHENLKELIYPNIFTQMSLFLTVWNGLIHKLRTKKQQEVGQITIFFEYFREPLDHVNFLLNFCLKEI